MRAGLTVLGVLFLCNPEIGIFDLLPDAVGFLLLFAALSRGACVNNRLNEARRGAGILCLCEIPRFFLGISYLSSSLRYPALNGLIANENLSAKTMLLTVLILYTILEIPLWFRFFRDLYEGVSSLGVYPTTDRKGEESRIRFARIFIILRSAFALLPEFLYLTDMDYLIQDFDHLYVDVRLAHPVIAVGGAILFLAVAIPWAVSTNRFFRALRQEGRYESACTLIENRDNEAVAYRRLCGRFSLGSVLFLLGCVFFLRLRVDGIYAVFHGFAPLLFLFSANCFAGILPMPRSDRLRLILCAAVAFIADFFAFYYAAFVFERWGDSHENMIRMTPVREHQQLMQYLLLALTLLAAAALLYALYLWLRHYLRVLQTPIGSTSLLDTMHERLSFREDREKLRRRPRIVFVLFALTALAGVISEFPYFAFYLSPFPIIQITLSIIALIAASFAVTDVIRAAKRKYNI